MRPGGPRRVAPEWPLPVGAVRLTLAVNGFWIRRPRLRGLRILPSPAKPPRTLRQQSANVSNRAGRAITDRKNVQPGLQAARNWHRRRETDKPTPRLPADAWSRDERTSRLEAVLFLAREPVNTRKLAQLAGLADGTEARTLIRRLNRHYDESGSAFRAEELAGGFQLMTRPKFGPWLRRLASSPVEVRLSAPAQETLAVVAYRQPVLRSEVEAIRGVDCGEILRQLMDRDLVRTAGRASELGRPYWYATTKRFLQVFGLKHLDDLPRAETLRNAAQPGQQLLNENQPRSGELSENLTSTECEDEEEIDRD